MKSEMRNRALQDLVQTVSLNPGREYVLGLEAGTIPLLALFILLLDFSPLTWANPEIIASLCVYAGEAIAAICCLCLRRLRPLGAGVLTMLILAPLLVYIVLTGVIILTGGDN